MFSPEFREMLDGVARSMRLIWAGIVTSTTASAAAALVLADGAARDLSDVLGHVLTGGAAAAAIASIAVRRTYLSETADGGRLWPDAAGGRMAAGVAALSAPERYVMTAILRMQVPFVVCLALNETVALLGMVRAFAGGAGEHVLPFVIVSLALDIFVLPRPERGAERLWLEAHRT
ncbi:MAG: hypothetical protein AB7Q29_17355 [Vicinamibacterales bacterium]